MSRWSVILSIGLLVLLAAASVQAKIILDDDDVNHHTHHEVKVAPSAPAVDAASLEWKIPSHENLASPTLFQNLAHSNPLIADRAHQALNCTICEGLVALLEPKLFVNSTEATVVALATLGCEIMKPLCHSPSACAAVCSGIVGEYAAGIWTIIQEVATPAFVCYKLKQCPKPIDPSPSTAIPVPSNLNNLQGETEWPSWQLTTGTGTFLHLSDAHIDPTYTIGSLADCPMPICCHVTDGPGTNANNTAGYWGDHRCDTTPQLAGDLLQYIASMNPPPDFIIYTGDDPAHNVYAQSQSMNLAALNLWNQMLSDVVGANQIPIFSTLGNHEIFPVNQFRGPVYDSWLYDALLDAWAPNLPEDAQATVQYGGYYQARVRPGLRVISLNSNYFTNDNFWLLANRTDAYDQLNWVANVLSQMVALDEKAIVICHHAIVQWNTDIATAFLNISEQYQAQIVNYFMGHTHFNQYQTLRDASGNPMHVAYIGGSVVPYTAVNPGFLQYEYNRTAVATNSSYAFLVERAVGHWLDLDQANLSNDTSTQWPVERYDMAADLGVPALDAASLYALSSQFTTNTTLYETYSWAQYKGLANPTPTPAINVQCLTGSNTAAEYHDCLHGLGANEAGIQAIEAIEALNC